MAALPNIIKIGDKITPSFEFDNASIAKVNGIFSVDVIGNEMAVDTVTAVVRYTGDGDIRGIAYGTPAWWYNNGDLVTAVFVRNVERIGKLLYRLTLISGVGLLENTIHVGNVYNGTAFEDVAAEIIGGAFPYTVDAAVASLPVYGWLPYDNGRNNLHQLLFATGVTLRKDANGEPVFAFLSDNNPRPVPDSRIAFGGTVDYQTIASAVEVTEHSYGAAPGTPDTLFDNTASALAAVSTLVVFSGPYNTLEAAGTLTIEDSAVNYAVVSGIGTLTGVPYSHYTRTISRINPAATVDNVKRVMEMFLVSMANSINVAKRVLAYYTSAKTIRSQLVIAGEKCGEILSLHDPYLDDVTAFLAEADVNTSSNLLATCRLVEGYTPTGQGNNFDTVDVLTGSGTWIVPPGVTEITIVLIGGGDGGTAGNAGETPGDLTTSSMQTVLPYPEPTEPDQGTRLVGIRYVNPDSAAPAKGGAPGLPGAGGKIYIATIAVTPGALFEYSSGLGGQGAVYNGENATQGTATAFGGYTSADGTQIEEGYADPITATVYGRTGDSGLAGGDGGGLVMDEAGMYVIATPGDVSADGITYTGGARGGDTIASYLIYPQYQVGVSYGSFGGGAAYGANGFDGEDGVVDQTSGTISERVPQAVTGGNGATALKPSTPLTYGQGGTGGHGGGAAGQNGAGIDETSPGLMPEGVTYTFGTWRTYSIYPNVPGGLRVQEKAIPGAGSDGGDGADGCIEIYYKAPLPVILSVNAQGHAIANNAEYLGDDTLELVPTQEANGGHLIYTEV